MFSIYQSSIYQHSAYQVVEERPRVGNQTLLGRGLAYHSWNLHYENELLKKQEREEREQKERVEALRLAKEETEAEADKLAKATSHKRKQLLEFNRNESIRLNEELKAAVVLLLEIQRLLKIRRNNIAFLLLTAAMPFTIISIN